MWALARDLGKWPWEVEAQPSELLTEYGELLGLEAAEAKPGHRPLHRPIRRGR